MMQGAKRKVFFTLELKQMYLAIHVAQVLKFLFTHFHTNLVQNPIVRYAKK